METEVYTRTHTQSHVSGCPSVSFTQTVPLHQLLFSGCFFSCKHTHTHRAMFPSFQRTLHTWNCFLETFTNPDYNHWVSNPNPNLIPSLHTKIYWFNLWGLLSPNGEQIPTMWLCKQIHVHTSWVICIHTHAHTPTWQKVFPVSFNNINPGDVTVPGSRA